jgi:cell division protein FtsI (penicillin-binding protein 3)
MNKLNGHTTQSATHHHNDTRSEDDSRKPRRFIAVFVIIGIALILLVYRYGAIMLGSSETTPLSGSRGTTTGIERGPILDRNGRILAIQTRLDTVWAWRPEIDDAEAVARALAPALGLTAAEVQDKIDGRTGSVTIKRTISPSESAAVTQLQEAGLIDGVRLRGDVGRSYPERSSLGGVIGFVGDDGEGLTGIEYTMEPWLVPGSEDLIYGSQVFLTVDMNIQYESERLAGLALEEHQANSVVLLTMDAHTGDILGYASVPTFDPNRFADYTDVQRRNRPISDVYEPGSVFKIFSVGSFLQLGGITQNSLFVTNGIYDRTEPPIRDLANYGTVDMPGIIRLSSNVGAALASETVDGRAFYNMLKLFSFGEETGIELNGEERGLIARPEEWSLRTQPTLAIGQEIGVTAIQLMAGATVYANRGILLKPNIIDKIVTADGRVVRDYGRTPVREVLSPEVAATVLSAMESAVRDDGTGRRLRYEGLRIAAKTGTAEEIDPATGTYSDDAFLASTLAILPVDDPQLIIYLAIDHPRGEEFYGGRIAAPLVRQYLDFLVPYLGIPVEGDSMVGQPGRITVQPVVLPALTDTVPDYTGLPKRALLPLLARTDMRVTLSGYGWVTSQNPAPGTPFSPGMDLTLELK